MAQSQTSKVKDFEAFLCLIPPPTPPVCPWQGTVVRWNCGLAQKGEPQARKDLCSGSVVDGPRWGCSARKVFGVKRCLSHQKRRVWADAKRSQFDQGDGKAAESPMPRKGGNLRFLGLISEASLGWRIIFCSWPLSHY